jgi:hypothetical protein
MYSSSGTGPFLRAGGQYLVLEKHHRVVVPDRAFHQTHGVVGRGRHDQFQAGQVHEHGVGALGVLSGRGSSSAGRRPEHQGEGGLSAEHVVNLGHLVDYLIHGSKSEGHHARADDRAKPAARNSDTGADVGLFGNGRRP